MENICIHFVGFKGDEYHRAIRVFGKPDYVHRQHDGRAVSMFLPGDVVICANGADTQIISKYSFDDSGVM